MAASSARNLASSPGVSCSREPVLGLRAIECQYYHIRLLFAVDHRDGHSISATLTDSLGAPGSSDARNADSSKVGVLDKRLQCLPRRSLPCAFWRCFTLASCKCAHFRCASLACSSFKWKSHFSRAAASSCSSESRTSRTLRPGAARTAAAVLPTRLAGRLERTVHRRVLPSAQHRSPASKLH